MLNARKRPGPYIFLKIEEASFETPPRKTETYDGVSEVCWSIADFASEEDPRSENTGPALLEGESKFIDFEGPSVFLPEKHSVLTVRSRALEVTSARPRCHGTSSHASAASRG